MRRIFIVWASILVLSISVFAQSEIKTCPVIEITSPASLTSAGETITFSVKVGNENSDLKYEWTVSAGTIVEGQSTSTIKIATTPEMSGTSVTAKVVIKGLSDKCPNELSESASIANLPIVEPIDDYGKSSWSYEASRLDSMFTMLVDHPHTVAFIMILETENEQAKKHIKKIVKYANFRQFPKQRLFFAIDKSGSQWTVIFINQENSKFPKCKNCEIIRGEDVK